MKRAEFLGWAAFNLAAAALNLAIPNDFDWAANWNMGISIVAVMAWAWMAWRGET